MERIFKPAHKSFPKQGEPTVTPQKMAAFMLVVFLLAMLIAVFVRHESRVTQIEYLTPDYNIGARIPGTNYVIYEGDTLEIIKNVRVDYTYKTLNKAERKQALEYIKSIRK